MELNESQTAKNLIASFAGESQARNRYTYYAGKAKQDGFVQIADIFTETAEQEKMHAKRFFKFMTGGEIEVNAGFPFGSIGSTEENLKAAAAGEKFEHSTLYPGFAKTAEAEGFAEIAAAWRVISIAEKQHEKRYNELVVNVAAGKVFSKDNAVIWRCLKCGYVHEGKQAIQICPACLHPQAYFEVLAENW